MSLIIYSSKSQPFGLLSNNANTPFSIEGVTYSNVTAYVYLNLFKSVLYQNKMRSQLVREPFVNALRLRALEDDEIFSAAINSAMNYRFKTYEQFRDLVLSTKGTELEFPGDKIQKAQNYGFTDYDEDIEDFQRVSKPEYNKLRILIDRLRSDKNIFFDPKYGSKPFSEVNNVVQYVVEQLLIDPTFPSKKYSEFGIVRNFPPNHDLVDQILSLDDIVPTVKRILGNKIYFNSIKKFKNHLLDVYLDYILETRYPYIQKQDYFLAKLQQREKEQNLELIENQLFELYKSGEIDDLIIRRLQFTLPLEALDDESISASTIGEFANSTTSVSANTKYTKVELDSPLFPYYDEEIVGPNKRKFRSALAFAYSKLFERIELPNFDVNRYDAKDLIFEYERLKNDYIIELITTNFETAATMKFQNQSLACLLKESGKSHLIWGDKSDQVLGAESNRAGLFLEYLRDTITIEPQRYIKDYQSLSSNLVLRSWLAFKASDIANTILLIKNPNKTNLEMIYKIRTNRAVSIPSDDSRTMNVAGLASNMQTIAYPIILQMSQQFMNLSESDAIHYLVESIEMSKPDELTKQLANEYLSKVYDNVISTVSRDTFITSILSQEQTSDKKQEKWWRIHYWAKEI